MTGSATSAAAAIKTFFMSSSPRYSKSYERWRGWGLSPTPEGNIHTTTCDRQGKRPIHGDSMATCGPQATVDLAGFRRALRGRTLGQQVLGIVLCGCRCPAAVGRDGHPVAQHGSSLLGAAVHVAAGEERLARAGWLGKIGTRQRHVRIRG